MHKMQVGEISNVGDRLAEERARLGMNQASLGGHGGVTKFTQLAYEKGTSFPNAEYLAKVAGVGVDVLYVVTGERRPRNQDVITWVEDDDDEIGGRRVVFLDAPLQQLVLDYATADATGQAYIQGVAALAARRAVELHDKVADDDGPPADMDFPALWRAVARSLSARPGIDPEQPMKIADFLALVDKVYEAKRAEKLAAMNMAPIAPPL